MAEVRIRTRHHGIVYQQTLFDPATIQPVSPKRKPPAQPPKPKPAPTGDGPIR